MVLLRLRTLLTAVLLLLSTACVQAQTVYKGLILVSHERFTLQGQQLHVYMKVSFDDNAIATGETLLFTPVFKSSGRAVRLATMAVSGGARERYEQRTDELQHRLRVNVPMVARDANTGINTFIYDAVIPYQSWMASSALYIECDESTWQGRDPHIYEDLLYSRLPLQTEPSTSQRLSVLPDTIRLAAIGSISASWVQFIAPLAGASGSSVVNGTMRLPYRMKPRKRYTRMMADSLSRIVQREGQRHSGQLFRIELVGYGAPINKPAKNERRAAKQTLLLKQALSARHLMGDNDVRITWVAEDWDSIRQLVAASHMPLRLAAIDIMRTIDVAMGREYALISLGAGTLYDFLRHDIFPRVCRLNYRLYYAPRASSYYDTARVPGGLLSALTPLNFYDTALAFGHGSQEFFDVIDLAACLFPNCIEASIDAGAVALLQGDVLKARQYLEPWASDQRAWCNLGLLYLMEGNRQQAEVYLRMAAADGVPSATEALHSLQSKSFK